jgi:hypothetical protein
MSHQNDRFGAGEMRKTLKETTISTHPTRVLPIFLVRVVLSRERVKQDLTFILAAPKLRSLRVSAIFEKN